MAGGWCRVPPWLVFLLSLTDLAGLVTTTSTRRSHHGQAFVPSFFSTSPFLSTHSLSSTQQSKGGLPSTSLEELEDLTVVQASPPIPPPTTTPSPYRQHQAFNLPPNLEKQLRGFLSPSVPLDGTAFSWLRGTDIEAEVLPKMKVLIKTIPSLNMTRFFLHGSRVMGPSSKGVRDWDKRVQEVHKLLRETLSELETMLTLEHAPNILLEDPQRLRERIRFLQEHMGGINVTSLVLGAPGLLACHWQEGVFEARLLGNLKRLQEELPGVSAYMVISKLPRLLLKDFDTKILPKIQFLEQALPSAGE